MKKGKNFFWGILFLLGAVAVVTDKLGYLKGIGFWSILFTIGFAGLLLDGIRKRKWSRILFAIAFICIVNADVLGIRQLVPWTVLLAAFLGTIGLNILFPERRERQYFNGDRQNCRTRIDETDSGEMIHMETTFGSAVKYIDSQELAGAYLEASFGTMGVYFDNAVLWNHSAEVYVDVSFGSITLYIPSGWKVIVDTDNSFGSTEEYGRCNPEGENVLIVKGDVAFGNLRIQYI